MSEQQAVKKQFIFIMTDSQRRDMISRLNERGENMHTPSLDKLCAQGLSFQAAYTTQPVCGPARAGLFTGTYPHTNGMLGNSMALSPHVRTIGQRLSAEGIRTAYIGKWHLDGGDYYGDGICPDGWDKDYWYDMRNYLDELSEEDRIRSRKLTTALTGEGITEDFTFAYRCTQRAIDFIEKHKDEDYLLVLSYDEPHDPYLSPKHFYEPFYERCLKKENQYMDFGSLPPHVQVWHERFKDLDLESDYGLGLLGANSYVDSQIGRVLDAAEKDAPQALLLYTSDHGESHGSHGIFSKGPAMYEEIANIPLIIRWKDKVKADISTEMPVSHIDLVPTILEYFEMERPESLEGVSLLSELQNPDISEKKENRPVFIEFNRYEIDHDGFGGYQPVRAVVKGKWKLTVSLLSSDELYHLADDPEEMKNLIHSEEHKVIRDELHDLILEWQNQTRDPMRGYYWEARPWRTDRQNVTWNCGGYARRRHREKGEVGEIDYSTGLPITEYARKY